MERTPPKFASNPDLSAPVEVDDLFINVRKRKHPDGDYELRMNALEQKVDGKLSKLNAKLDESLAELIDTSIKSALAAEFSKITASLDALNKTVQGLRSDNESFKASLVNINTRLDEMEKSLNHSCTRQDDFEVQLQTLQKQSRQNNTENIKQLETKLATMEQQARDCNIEIVNIPERRNENLLNIVTNLATIVKQQVLVSDIVAVHRVPHADQKDSRPKNIIVKFGTRILRDNIMASCRSMKNLNTEQLGISGSPQKVYVNEHLTIQNKRLFRECRNRAKLQKYKYVWVKHGVILVRKSDTAPVQAIRSEQDLGKIK